MGLVFEVLRIGILTLTAFVGTILLVPLFINFLYKYRLGKQIRVDPNAPIYRSLHKKKAGTPTMGGLLIWGFTALLALVLGFIAAWWPESFIAKFNFLNRAETFLPLGMMIFAGLIGLIDDIAGVFKKGILGGGIRFRHRFILYSIIAAVGAWWFFYKLEWDLLHIPFLGDFNIGIWYIPIFIFIIIATSFSTNQTDGLDGLAAGVLLVTLLSLTAISFVQGRFDLSALTAVIAGALLAFLWFNIHPASFFMGDTGAMSLGTVVGVITMLTNTVFILPFIAFILVIEALSTLLQLGSRRLLGRKIFLSAPIHHHFEAKGWPETKVTMRFWIISLMFTVIGLVIFFLDLRII